MSIVISAITDFKNNFTRMLGYIGQEDVSDDDNQELSEMTSLDKKTREILDDGKNYGEPLDYKKMLELDNNVKVHEKGKSSLNKDIEGKNKNKITKNEKGKSDKFVNENGKILTKIDKKNKNGHSINERSI